MLRSLDEIDRARERLADLIDKRRLLESQGKEGRDLHVSVVGEIARLEAAVEADLDERRRFPLADLSDRIARWVTRTFGAPNLTDRRERALRIVEEAIELAQAEDVNEDVIAAVVRRVYSRPVGTLPTEAGGLLLTIAAWQANTPTVNVFECAAGLLRYLEATEPEVFREKHRAKVAAGVGRPMPEAPAPSGPVRPPE